MNTANKLTVLRVFLVPIFLVFLLIQQIPLNYLWALIIFVLASLTDMWDGQIARKNNLVTNFGKFLDPLADKVLVISALVAFVELRLTSAVIVIIIVARELLVTSLRLVAVSDGTVIAASIWGKLKTVSQMVAIIAVLLFEQIARLDVLPDTVPLTLFGDILMIVAAGLTLISGVQYLWVNRKFINTTK